MFEDVVSRLTILLPFVITVSIVIYKISDLLANKIIGDDDDD